MVVKYKLRYPFRFLTLLLSIIFSAAYINKIAAQDTIPPVTSDWSTYREQVLKEPSKKMVELKSRIPNLVYDLRYATSNNFMNRRMYPPGTDQTYMREPAVNALQKIQEDLNAIGLGLKIFDAYRPYSVTVKFWELVGDERYVANPSKGSGHNRGIAVDVTLIDIVMGIELQMGTGYDNFTDTAHANFAHLPPNILEHRMTLRKAMEKHGFLVLDTEWWHFFLPASSSYEILNIPFKELRKKL
jgi:D-alanyl-D-alanine dipeptidase